MRVDSILPSNVLSQAVDLSVVGCNELAWPRAEVLKAIDVAERNNMAILGGDVYVVDGQVPAATYDNWWMDRPRSMRWTVFVAESCHHARTYIHSYQEGRRAIVYCPVFCSEDRYIDLDRREMTEQIVQILREMQSLLRQCGHHEEATWFEDRVRLIESPTAKPEEIRDELRRVKSILGGMGSFTDVPLTPPSGSALTRQMARSRQFELVAQFDEAVKTLLDE